MLHDFFGDATVKVKSVNKWLISGRNFASPHTHWTVLCKRTLDWPLFVIGHIALMLSVLTWPSLNCNREAVFPFEFTLSTSMVEELELQAAVSSIPPPLPPEETGLRGLECSKWPVYTLTVVKLMIPTWAERGGAAPAWTSMRHPRWSDEDFAEGDLECFTYLSFSVSHWPPGFFSFFS